MDDLVTLDENSLDAELHRNYLNRGATCCTLAHHHPVLDSFQVGSTSKTEIADKDSEFQLRLLQLKENPFLNARVPSIRSLDSGGERKQPLGISEIWKMLV